MFILFFVLFIYFKNKTKDLINPISSEKTTEIEKKLDESNYLEIKLPNEIVAGECNQIQVTLKDQTNKEIYSNYDLFLKILDSKNNAITLFEKNTCGVTDSPTLKFKILKKTNSSYFYTIFYAVGPIKTEAVDSTGSSIKTQFENTPLVQPNFKKTKIIFSKLPKYFIEGEPFSVDIIISDILGIPLNSTLEPVKLSLKVDEKNTSLPLGEAKVVNGVAEFKNLLIDELDGNKAQLVASIGDNVLTSDSIIKGTFKSRTIQVEVVGMQTFSGHLITPSSIEVINKIWKIEKVNSKKTVNINGVNYSIEFKNFNSVILKPM